MDEIQKIINELEIKKCEVKSLRMLLADVKDENTLLINNLRNDLIKMEFDKNTKIGLLMAQKKLLTNELVELEKNKNMEIGILQNEKDELSEFLLDYKLDVDTMQEEIEELETRNEFLKRDLEQLENQNKFLNEELANRNEMLKDKVNNG